MSAFKNLFYKERFNKLSLAHRLVLSNAVLSIAALLIAGLVLSALNRRFTESNFDARLRQYVKVLVADITFIQEGETAEIGSLGEPQFFLPLSGWYWQVIKVNDEKKTTDYYRISKSLFSERLPLFREPLAPNQTNDFKSEFITGPDGMKLRIAEQMVDLGDENRFLISVAGPAEEINGEIRRFNIALFVALGILAGLLTLLTLIQVHYGLRPLLSLLQSLGAIRRGESERIEGDYPQEIAPLASEINQLVEANREVIERARRQVGNLAHALKTPLSVLVNEADAAPMVASPYVQEQTNIMRDQVQYYLDRARAAARAAAIGTVTNVEPVLNSFIRMFERMNRSKSIDFSLNVEENLRFRGEKQDFEEMIGNLIDNAAKFAFSEVKVNAELIPSGELERKQLIITIDDDGPGVPAAKRAEMLKRGQRLDETKPGSGLGLSIVVDFAGLYGGNLILEESPLGGLRAKLQLPAI